MTITEVQQIPTVRAAMFSTLFYLPKSYEQFRLLTSCLQNIPKCTRKSFTYLFITSMSYNVTRELDRKYQRCSTWNLYLYLRVRYLSTCGKYFVFIFQYSSSTVIFDLSQSQKSSTVNYLSRSLSQSLSQIIYRSQSQS